MGTFLAVIGIIYVIYKLSSESWEQNNGYVPPAGTHIDNNAYLCDVALGKSTKQAQKDIKAGKYTVPDNK